MKTKRDIKHYINYIIDNCLLISVIAVLLSSYILWFVLKRGTGLHGDPFCQQFGTGSVGNYYTVLEWPRYTWIDIHNWASIALLAIVVFHIIFHWRWIVESVMRAKRYFAFPMMKVREQFIVATALFIFFMIECLSGFVVWLILPRGLCDYAAMLSGGARTFWGLQRNIWLDIHVWLALAIISILIIHLMSNWKWILNITKKVLRTFFKI